MSNLTELLPAGGGGKNVDFVASGTLANGQAVALKTDGTVTAITGQVGTATAFASGANTTLNTGMCFDPDNNKVIIAYRVSSSSPYYGYAVVGTVSGMSISFGTPVAFYSSGSINGTVTAVYDTTANKVVVTFYPQAGGLYAIVGTVSGTSISFGSTANISAGPSYPSSVYDSSANKTLVSYSNGSGSGYPTVVAISVSGTTPSFGSPVVVVSAAIQGTSLSYDTTANKSSLVVTHQSSSYLKAYAITISGTTPSAGSATDLGSYPNGADNLSTAYDPDINRHIVVFRDRTSGASQYFSNYIIFQISGTSIISNTAATAFNNLNGGAPVVVYDTGSNKVVVVYNTESYTISAKVGTATTSSIAFGDQITVDPAINQYSIGAVYDSAADRVVVGSYVGSGIVFNAGGIPNTSFIGITDAAISNAASGSVTIKGGINKTVTGLTPNATYYVQADGRLAAGVTSIPFDISGATYASQSFNALSVVGGNVCDVAFKPDGLKMFLCAGTGIIYEYALSTAFDVSSASYSNTSGNISAQTPALTGISFSTSGAKMYALGTTNDTIYEFNLSTPWSVVSSSLSYSSNSFSIASKETGPTGVTLNPLGTKVYIIGYGSDSVHEFALSTAFDISSASFTSSFSVASQETSPQALQFNSDGTLMFICGGNSDKVHAYDLSSAYDISSSVYNSAFLSTASEMATPMGFAFNPLGTKLTVFGNNSIVYGYATTQTAFVTTVKAGRALSSTSINLDYTT